MCWLSGGMVWEQYNIFFRLWPRLDIHVCLSHLLGVLQCCALLLFVCPQSSSRHKWGTAIVSTMENGMLQNNPKTTTVATPGVWSEFHYGWNLFLFPILLLWDERQMAVFTLQRGNTKHMLSLTLKYFLFCQNIFPSFQNNDVMTLFWNVLANREIKTIRAVKMNVIVTS